ncbi:hypothetical protein PMNALOAF_1374 [Methylobacterium adhaesivum]|uniref:MAPEG family protein n=1 Tax=Methylobacterium adhaesivum TaxID=333297 RepID=A0ABT8BMT4_9HYPH|nr:MAPEG family protein [Methylobacterium adhaesivum]MDN3592526.1 MAPEG family protein [Methylobacterium adhaesivum]GJD30130.1 hypothetical protein PMNALOAF_1374 [Methylobacterium adhaesivum]
MPGDDAFRQAQRRVALAMALGLTVTMGWLALAVALDAGHPAQPLAERLQAALRADLFVVGWLAAAIADVARRRFFSRDDIAGSAAGAASRAVREAAAILQNTAEQVVLAVPVHLALATVMARPTVALAALAALFGAGRALFWLGYRRGPGGRALGFALTFYPTVAALGLAAAMLVLGRDA